MQHSDYHSKLSDCFIQIQAQRRKLVHPTNQEKAMSISADPKPLEASYVLNSHLHLPGFTEHFASQTDAYLVVEEHRIPVHTMILAMTSPVFAELFKTAADDSSSSLTIDDKMCIPMPGHIHTDVCSAVKYIYQRCVCQLDNAPSKQLWKSVNIARSVIECAHKYDMKPILEECDACLSEKAQQMPYIVSYSDVGAPADTGRIFQGIETTVAWAILAEEFDLKKLLAQAELFMVSDLQLFFLRYDNHVVQRLSKASLLRVLHAAQLTVSKIKDCPCCPKRSLNQKHSCKFCQKPIDFEPCHHVSIQQLISWQ